MTDDRLSKLEAIANAAARHLLVDTTAAHDAQLNQPRVKPPQFCCCSSCELARVLKAAGFLMVEGDSGLATCKNCGVTIRGNLYYAVARGNSGTYHREHYCRAACIAAQFRLVSGARRW